MTKTPRDPRAGDAGHEEPLAAIDPSQLGYLDRGTALRYVLLAALLGGLGAALMVRLLPPPRSRAEAPEPGTPPATVAAPATPATSPSESTGCVQLIPAESGGEPLPEGALRRYGDQGFRVGSQVDQLAYGPAGKLLVARDFEHGVSVFEVATGALRYRLDRSQEPRRGLTRVARVSMVEGRDALGVPSCGALELRDLGTGRLLERTPLPGLFSELVVDREGRFAIGYFERPGDPAGTYHVRRWELPGGAPAWTVPSGFVHEHFQLSPSGRYLLTTERVPEPEKSTWLVVRETSSGAEQLRTRLDTPGKGISYWNQPVAFLPGEEGLVTSLEDGPPVRIELATGRVEPLEGDLGRRWYTRASRDGTRWLVGTKVLRAPDQQVLGDVGEIPGSRVYAHAAAFAPGRPEVAFFSDRIRVVDYRAGASASSRDLPSRPFHEVRTLPDGSLLALDGEGGLSVWGADGRRRVVAKQALDSGSPLAVDPAGEAAFGITPGRRWVRVELATGATRRLLERRFRSPRVDITYGPEGPLLASADIWDSWGFQVLRPGDEEGRSLPTELVAAGLADMRFSPDGTQLVAAGRRFVEVWDLGTWTRRLRLEMSMGADLLGGDPPVLCFQRAQEIREDGASGGSHLEFWGVDPQRQLARVRNPGHVKVLDPARRLLIAGGSRDRLEFLDLDDGRRREVRDPVFSTVDGFALSPDGATLVSTHQENSALAWDLAALLERAREVRR